MRSWMGRKPLWIGALLVAGGVVAISTIPRSNASLTPHVEESRLIASKSGMVRQLVPNEGQIIEKGEDIVMLDDTKEREALLFAQDELAKLMSEARESGIAVALPETPPGLGGTIVQTGPMRADTRGEGLPKNVKPLPDVRPEGASLADPTPDPKALADIKGKAQKAIEEGKSEAERYAREIDDIKLEVEEAERSKETARIITDRAKQAADRGRMLLAQGAISQNESIRLDGQVRLQQGILDASTKRVDEAKQKIAILEGEREKALGRVKEAEENLKSAPEAATPKRGTVTASAPPKLPEAKTPTRYARPVVIIPRRAETSTAPAKVEIDKGAKRETDDRLQKAKTKIDVAEIALLERRIMAPRRLRIIKWLIKPADVLNPNSPIAIVEFLPEPPSKAAAPNPPKMQGPALPLQKSTGLSDNTR